MATTYGNNARKSIETITNPVVAVDVAEQGGRVRIIYDTYEADGNTATDNTGAVGTIINMAKMPKGSRVGQETVAADDLGAAGTIKVGDSGDDDRFILATVFGATGKIAMVWPRCLASDVIVANTTVVGGFAGVGMDAFGHEYTTPTWIIGTTATAALTGTIKWAVWYTID